LRLSLFWRTFALISLLPLLGRARLRHCLEEALPHDIMLSLRQELGQQSSTTRHHCPNLV